MNRFIRISLVVVGLFFIVALVYSFTHRESSTQIDQKLMAPNSLGSAIAFKPSSLVLSNGYSFVEYNYNSGQSQVLGPNSNLGTVDSLQVSADKNFILFHEVDATGGLLTSALKQNGVPASPFGYWWVYNIQTQALHVFTNVLSLEFNDNSVYSLQKSTSGESISSYSLSNNYNLIRTVNVLSSSQFMPISSGLVLQTSDNKIYYTANGTVNDLIASDSNLIAAFDGGTVIYMNKDNNKLFRIDVNTNSTKTIAQNVVGQPIWNGMTGVLYNTSVNLSNNNWQAHYFDVSTKKSVIWKTLANVGEFGSSKLKPISLFGPQSTLVNDPSGIYYLVGSGLATVNTTNL